MPYLNRTAKLASGLIAGTLLLSGCTSLGNSHQSEKPVLESLPIEQLLPTADQYASYNGGMRWQLSNRAMDNYTAPPTAQPTSIPSATVDAHMADEYGQSCAETELSFPTISAGYKEGITQEISGIGSDNGGNETVVIIRLNSAADASKFFAWAKKAADVCPSNKGTFVFTSPDIGTHDSVGLTNVQSPGSNAYFTGYAVRGDLLVIVQDDSDPGTDGASTEKYVMNHIDELIAKSK